MSEDILRCLVLSFMRGISCQLFFETIVPPRKWRRHWIRYTVIPTFAAGSMLTAFTQIPPYVLQPVRLIIIVAVTAQLYFQVHAGRNLILSMLYCCTYWIVSTAVLSVLYTVYGADYINGSAHGLIENLTEAIHLCLVMAFHYGFQNRIRGLATPHWKKFSLIPLLYLTIIMAVNMIPGNGTTADKYARLAVISSLAVLFLFLFYFTTRTLEQEIALQRLQISTVHTRNQMNMYHSMQAQYEQQRRFLHDYKNQLNCIQGLLGCGQTKEASDYITRMTGTLRTQFGEINTNHTVVNIILNQKYQTALDKGITMTLVINDLSGLAMPEEDLVTLLANLLDNAVEACEKLDKNRVIQFKMVMEDNHLILSVRNPVDKPVRIRNNTIVTSKKDSACHGTGLSNVDLIVRKYHGTSILQCGEGWFSFSAMLQEFAQP